MKIELIYPNLPSDTGGPVSEMIEADVIEGRTSTHWGKAELREHAMHIPLVPGDVVAFDALDVVREVVTLVPIYTYDVEFALPVNLAVGTVLPQDDKAVTIVRETTEQWQREAWVTRYAGFSYFVSAQSQHWLEDRVVLCKYVDHITVVRWPEMELDLSVALANAQFGELTGPWA